MITSRDTSDDKVVGALKSLEQLLQTFYESPSLACTGALPLIDAELPRLRAAIDAAEWTEKGLAEWRGVALSNGKQAEAARATARVAIGHLERVLKGGHARVSPEQRDQWRRDAEDWLTSIGFE